MESKNKKLQNVIAEDQPNSISYIIKIRNSSLGQIIRGFEAS